jgi:hypothetical protein
VDARLASIIFLALTLAPVVPFITAVAQLAASPGFAAALGSSTAVLVANLSSASQSDVRIASLFYASGLYWMVIYDANASAFYYTTSQTGLSWSTLQPLGVPFSPDTPGYGQPTTAFYYSPAFNTLYYAYTPSVNGFSLNVYIYRLQPNANGTLTVAGNETVSLPALLTGQPVYIYSVKGLAVGPQGHLWIAVVYVASDPSTQSDYSMPALVKGSATNGTFGGIDTGFPIALDSQSLFTTYNLYLLPHPSLGAVTVYQPGNALTRLNITWWNASTVAASYFYNSSSGAQYPLAGAAVCRDRLLAVTYNNSYIWDFNANGLALLTQTPYPGYNPISTACDNASGLAFITYISSGSVYYANYSAYSYTLGQPTAVSSTGGAAYGPTAVMVGSNLLTAWLEYYSSGYTLVKTAVADTLTLAVGIPATLTLTASIAPNDTIAPHLYTWYFNGRYQYVDTPLYIDSLASTGFTLEARAMSIIYMQVIVYNGRGVFEPAAFYWDNMTMLWWAGWNNGWSFTIKSMGSGYTVTYRTDLDTAWHSVAGVFNLTAGAMSLYVDGALRGTKTGIPQPVFNHYTMRIGYYNYWVGFISPAVVYSRPVYDSEVYNAYAYNILNATGLVLFLDATFYNGTTYLDLSGLGNNGVGYNNVSRVADTRQWLYLVKNLSQDGLVHFRFFPANTRIEIYDTNNNLVTSFIIAGAPNQAGLIEDYAVSLPAGNYTVKAYTYVDKTVNQNNGSTRYTYIARYSPGDAVRLALSTNALGSLRYQVYNQSSGGSLVADATVSTNLSYTDIQLPSSNATWAVQAYAGAPAVYWSNQASLRTDYLIPTVATSKARADLSTDIVTSYAVTYTDGSTPPAYYLNVSSTVAGLGVYTPADVWWRVDVYRGATTSAEPPNPSYYTYLGTVYPISTHSYFTHRLEVVPSGWDTGYVYLGGNQNDAPYWAKAVGCPATNFALVYTSMIYLPQTGNYTFTLISRDGSRLYINGTLVIDGWGGSGTRSATVSLSQGWYNITVKYWKSGVDPFLMLGVTLPNGTAVNPLVPAYGIQMKPPDQSYNATLPSPGLTLINVVLINVVFIQPAAIPNLSLGTVGQVNLTIRFYDPGAWFNPSAGPILLTWDQVVVKSFTPSQPRFTVGDTPSFNTTAVYAYDNTAFSGSFTLNDTSTKTSVGAYGYSITGVSDPNYGLTRFTGNTTTTVIFDKLVLSSYSLTVGNTTLANGTRVDYTSPVNVTAVLYHAYDGLPLNSSNAVSVQLAGVPATWNGSAWVATVQSPGRITAVLYSVVSYAKSTLGVRYVDSTVFKVIYDSVNATLVGVDLAGNTVTLRLYYGYDGTPLSSGTVFLNDSGSIVSGSVSNGLITIGFNRFANGTVSFVNASDNALVFSNPANPGAMVYKWCNGVFSILGTAPVSYMNSTILPGYVRLAYTASGNTSVLANTSLTPVLVLDNGVPISFSVINGVVVAYNVGSTITVYYSTPVQASTMPGAAPVGAVYEIGFVDNNLTNYTVRIGVLVNGSYTVPVLYYNNATYYGSPVGGLSFPLDVALSWECNNGTPGVSYMLVYMLGNKTYYSFNRYVFNATLQACPAALYPYIYVSGNLTGVVDKYGGVISDMLRYAAMGVLKLSVAGPIPAGGLVKFITLSTPLQLVYNAGAVSVQPGSGSMLTLVGFRGFLLSYSVAGVTVSNILITTNTYNLDFPAGIALVAIVDPSTLTISLVQVTPPTQPQYFTTTSIPGIYIPLPSTPPPVLQPPSTWGDPGFIVLYGAAVAVAIVAARMTGSLARGIVVAATAFGLVFLGIGVFTGNYTAVGIAVVAFVAAVAVEIARRQV